MDITVNRLVECDELQNWGVLVTEVLGEARRSAFRLATPLWICRMIDEGKLLLHPIVIRSLKDQAWVPDDLQKQMIWASIVCKLDGPEGKSEKSKIRRLIQAKYGNDWWEAVYERAGRVWPAWDRYRKNILSVGVATHTMAMHSTILGMAMNDELNAVLKMVPSS